MKSIVSVLFVLTSFGAMGQDILGMTNKIVDSIIESMTDTTGIPEESFVLHDTTRIKLGLDINAVCRVVMTDGSIVEGFIEFASDGDPNSFYFENGKSSNWKVKQRFDIDFYFGKFAHDANEDPKIFRNYDDQPDDTVSFADVTAVYYLERTGASRIGTPGSVAIVKEDGDMYMKITSTVKCEHRYRMRDSLDIYQALAPDTYIRKLPGLAIVTVKVSEIVSFELVAEPRKKWLNIISQNRTEADSAHQAEGKPGYPSKTNWYHAIHRDPALAKHVQKCIDL